LTALLDLPITPDTIEKTEVAFGEWLPDKPANNNPGAIEALNILPAEGSYVPFAQHTPQDATLADAARGAISVVLSDDIAQVYVGTVNGVFTRLGGGLFISIYTAPSNAEYAWQFIRVNEQMVGIHNDHIPQRSAVGTTDPFVNVGGAPPTAACGAQVGDFLMLGNILVDPDDGGNPFPSRVRWGGFNNIDLPWITDPATQADFQDMPEEGGPVVAISGRDVGTIYQARMISRATYRGLPNIFDIVHVEEKRGAIARDCIVNIGQYQFFIAEDGFFLWNGTNATPIGDGRVNRYFFNRLQWSRRNRIVGAVDYINGCILWAFPTDVSGTLNEIIIYSYRENRWSHSIQTLEYLFSSANSNMTLDELIAPLESYTTSFDSPTYRQGGRTRLSAFNTLHTYGLFDGAPMAATLDTGEFSGPDSRHIFINSIRPLIDVAASVITAQAATREQLIGGPLVFGSAVIQELDGNCPVLADGRYMKFRINVPVNVAWSHAVGVEVARKATGNY
jgi:hypothetical protein